MKQFKATDLQYKHINTSQYSWTKAPQWLKFLLFMKAKSDVPLQPREVSLFQRKDVTPIPIPFKHPWFIFALLTSESRTTYSTLFWIIQQIFQSHMVWLHYALLFYSEFLQVCICTCMFTRWTFQVHGCWIKPNFTCKCWKVQWNCYIWMATKLLQATSNHVSSIVLGTTNIHSMTSSFSNWNSLWSIKIPSLVETEGFLNLTVS